MFFGIIVVKRKYCHLEKFFLDSDLLKWENITKERENLTKKAIETSTFQEAPERKVVDFSEQEVPRLCRELMTLNHCKLYKKNKKFPKQRFIQNKNEGDFEFLRRVNQVTHTLLEEEMFKIKFGMNDTKQKCQKSIQQNSGYAKRKINPQHEQRSSLLNRRSSRRKNNTLE
ncbi:hypothetical protein T02_10009 [Trichinella nativa]|uniref:Uncharacterized protein n=1 Tax=Trichinella nativa TaxID=6335 RepID=A0A0V1KX80_9BILA|nr:hypothetical protein T06_7510 [Trichinella sp. T6]KRZ51745.1 hypothetical protein T02_10009 [Trichinella nativa]